MFVLPAVCLKNEREFAFTLTVNSFTYESRADAEKLSDAAVTINFDQNRVQAVVCFVGYFQCNGS